VQCQSLDGKVFQVGKGPMPPIHIGCRSVAVAEIDGRYKSVTDKATRASRDGQVAAKETYHSWLKKQSPEFQADALGPTRAKLLREGGLSAERFAEMNLNRDFKPLTLAEMRAKEPLAFGRAGI